MDIVVTSDRPDWPLAVVVGAGGLGMAVARRLGTSHRLLVADRDGDHVARQCAALRSEGHDAASVVCDVTDPEAIGRLAGEAAARAPVRTLANVVGLSPSAQNFEAIMAVNLIAASHVADAFAPILERGGAAVFISSSSAHLRPVPEALAPLLDDPQQAGFLGKIAQALGDQADPAHAYMFSKAGLNRLCVRKASEWGRRGLRIVSLSPGLIATPQGAESYKHSTGKMALYRATPLGRECSMLEIAEVVAFLVSRQASYISGTDILVDGGLIASVT